MKTRHIILLLLDRRALVDCQRRGGPVRTYRNIKCAGDRWTLSTRKFEMADRRYRQRWKLSTGRPAKTGAHRQWLLLHVSALLAEQRALKRFPFRCTPLRRILRLRGGRILSLTRAVEGAPAAPLRTLGVNHLGNCSSPERVKP